MKERFALAFISDVAAKEYLALRNPLKGLVDKGLRRLQDRADEIGKPLGGNLKGCRELKFRSDGLRIIYRIKNGEVEIVEIIAIARRDKGEAFRIAQGSLDALPCH